MILTMFPRPVNRFDMLQIYFNYFINEKQQLPDALYGVKDGFYLLLPGILPVSGPKLRKIGTVATFYHLKSILFRSQPGKYPR
jgi:ABC-type transporter lipoprotein component MlaA